MPGSVALSGSLETVGINRVVMHRHPLERASSEQREDRIEDRSGHFNRHHDLLAEIAALRQGLDAQRAQLTAVSEQVQASGFASALEALRSDLAELRHQQDLQAGALRDGLMEIHQHRAELVELQNLRREDAAAGVQLPKADGDEAGRGVDGLAEALAAESEERRTCIAELHARLEREVTEVLRKTGRQRDELCAALDRERVARGKQVEELLASLPGSTAAPSSTGMCAADGDGSAAAAAMPLGLAVKLAEALEAEREARATEGAELRASLARLASEQRLLRGGSLRAGDMECASPAPSSHQKAGTEELPSCSVLGTAIDSRCLARGGELDSAFVATSAPDKSSAEMGEAFPQAECAH